MQVKKRARERMNNKNNNNKIQRKTRSTKKKIMMLFLGEAFGFFDSKIELFDELLIGFVWRKVEPIEASVRSRQPVLFAHLFDAESLRSIRAH